jgi:hypothetical protein
LPGFGQRGHDLVKPVPQRGPPRGRVPQVGNVSGDVRMHRVPVDVVDPGGQAGRETVGGGDAKQPASQPVRTGQLRGIGHSQPGGDENVTGGVDCRIGIGPQPFGAAAKHCVTMLVDHIGEHCRALPLRLDLPEPSH